ncbi:MAG TPA: shikimate kinase [Bryobacteraceae bacterium]|nr:shikimate kinase [Bryobacteraceae bacterium]
MILKLKRTPGIFLVGFMGSGKTTIGRKLAEELGWSFADLDDDIETREAARISDIFENRGEEEFRRMEALALEERVRQVRAAKPLVLALGGGAFVQPANRELIAASGVSFWLDCQLERIEERVAGFAHRPLAKDPQRFRKLYEVRKDAYAQADFRIPIASDDPMDAVRSILETPGLF